MRDAEPGGHLVGPRRPAERGFERLAGLFHLAGLAAHQPRHPVHRAQLVEHGAADARHAVGLELDAALEVEGVDGVHQAEDAGADEVVEIDAVGQPRPDAFGVVLDQRQIPLDELIAQLDRRLRPVVAPELRDVHVHMRHHGLLPDVRQAAVHVLCLVESCPASATARRAGHTLPALGRGRSLALGSERSAPRSLNDSGNPERILAMMGASNAECPGAATCGAATPDLSRLVCPVCVRRSLHRPLTVPRFGLAAPFPHGQTPSKPPRRHLSGKTLSLRRYRPALVKTCNNSGRFLRANSHAQNNLAQAGRKIPRSSRRCPVPNLPCPFGPRRFLAERPDQKINRANRRAGFYPRVEALSSGERTKSASRETVDARTSPRWALEMPFL